MTKYSITITDGSKISTAVCEVARIPYERLDIETVCKSIKSQLFNDETLYCQSDEIKLYTNIGLIIKNSSGDLKHVTFEIKKMTTFHVYVDKTHAFHYPHEEGSVTFVEKIKTYFSTNEDIYIFDMIGDEYEWIKLNPSKHEYLGSVFEMKIGQHDMSDMNDMSVNKPHSIGISEVPN